MKDIELWHGDCLELLNKGGSLRYPRSVIRCKTDPGRCVTQGQQINSIHPTQKPLSLFHWCLRTYSNAGNLVLDPTAGSMGVAVAAHQTGRRAICIERDDEYYRRGVERVKKALSEPRQEVML